jgi:hypothetical protein
MLAAALVMVVIGFGFKIAAVPFHLWAPDTYQGAPNASAAFIASSSKVASFAILAKVVVLGFGGLAGSGDWGGFSAGWVPLLAVVGLFSMVLGIWGPGTSECEALLYSAWRTQVTPWWGWQQTICRGSRGVMHAVTALAALEALRWQAR